MEPKTEYFIKTRKGEGKEYAREIIEFLKGGSGRRSRWVQSKELHDCFVKNGRIPEGPTLFRILAGLVSYQIVEREERIVPYPRSRKDKKKISVFYRLTPFFANQLHYSEEENETALKRWELQSLELFIDYTIAMKLIKKHDLTGEYDWMKEHDEIKKKYAAYVRALKEQL